MDDFAGRGVIRWFAVCQPGLEAPLAREIAALSDVKNITEVSGGVEFSGPIAVGVRANLWLRTATKILARVGELEAREFSVMRRQGAKLAWKRFVPARSPIVVRAAQTGSRLYHTGAISDCVVLTLADAIGEADEKLPPRTVLVRGTRNHWTFSVDASGELLHKRGWRTEAGEAPLRETFAAQLLMLCDWKIEEPLYDPMCGAGTIPIEAAHIALGVAPGIDRAFSMESWPGVEPEMIDKLREEARAQKRASLPAPIFGSDAAPRAIELARSNAERAGIAAIVSLSTKAVAEITPPAARGLVLCNPPYGRRLSNPRDVQRLLKEFGRVMKARFAGWRIGVLVPNENLSRNIGLGKPSSVVALRNGGLRVSLLRYDAIG